MREQSKKMKKKKHRERENKENRQTRRAVGGLFFRESDQRWRGSKGERA